MNTNAIISNMRAASLGLALAVITVLFGQGMGIVFGLNEDTIKGRLRESATTARDTVYKADDAAIKAVLDKSWVYMQRAHLHAGGMGTSAVVLIMLVGLLEISRRMVAAIGIGLGAGGLGYSPYWMWAGFRAPAVGGTNAAKESLAWLAIPSSGAFVLATIAVLIVLLVRLTALRRDNQGESMPPGPGRRIQLNTGQSS